jgi:uncharacterized protein YndB with AHSA1/START domain
VTEAGGNGYALFTSNAIDALGLEPDSLGLQEGEEMIEHLGQVTTFTLDLEALWQTETSERRLEIAAAGVILDIEATLPAEPSVVWAHLTSPALRTTWEGPLVIEETSPGGRRGVGTTAQCVTGRLATLEEIVDWQPFERIAWRLAVAGLGPVAAVADLDRAEGGTRLRLRWGFIGESPVPHDEVARIAVEKNAAFARLATVVADARGPGTFAGTDTLTSEPLQGLL